MCPHCHKDAPLVYRGVVGYCTACGKGRPPLVTSSVSLAGQGARMGGVLARGFGWVIIAVGFVVAAILFGLAELVAPGAMVSWILGAMTMGMSGLIGGGLLLSGKKLSTSGVDAQRFAREKAVIALAAHKGGTLTATDMSRSLDVPLEEASAFLTDLAKRVPDEVGVELDNEGGLLYTFNNARAHSPSAPPAAPGEPRIRVEANSTRSAPKDPIDAEFEALEEKEAEAARARR